MESRPGAESQGLVDRLTVRTVALPGPVELIGQLPGPQALAWVRGGDGLVGWGETARVILPAGEDRFTAAEKWLRALFEGADVNDQVGEPGCGPVAFGSFTFDPAEDGSVLVVPATVMGQRRGRAWLTTIGPAASAGPAPVPLNSPAEVRWHDGSLAPPEWEHVVASAVRLIKQGRLHKVVLARDLYAHASDDIDSRVLLQRLAGRYPSCYTFACAGLVGATPELLISRHDADVSSLVLAGTAPRGHDEVTDAELAAGLLSSAKDAQEHSYAVAGVRAVLAARCSQLRMDETPSLVRLANVQHLGTHITGQLASASDAFDHSVLALVAALHPTGAVCGSPAETAMEVIRELEGMDRGRYAGPVGWVDACGNGEWGVALRCAEVEGPCARLFAGCGIVAGSDPAAELAEAQAKFHPMKCAIEG